MVNCSSKIILERTVAFLAPERRLSRKKHHRTAQGSVGAGTQFLLTGKVGTGVAAHQQGEEEEAGIKGGRGGAGERDGRCCCFEGGEKNVPAHSLSLPPAPASKQARSGSGRGPAVREEINCPVGMHTARPTVPQLPLPHHAAETETHRPILH